MVTVNERIFSAVILNHVRPVFVCLMCVCMCFESFLSVEIMKIRSESDFLG